MDAGNTCNLTGAWALKITATVSWAATGVVGAGTNQTVNFWALIQGTESGTTLSGTIVPCGIMLPDFMSFVGGLTYGVTFPNNTIFDSGDLTPVSASLTVSSTAPGATLTTAAEANLIGINFANPATAAWPNLATAQADQVDADKDGNPGVTAIPKSGSPYSPIPVQLIPTVYADQLYFTLRSVISLNGTLSTCTTASGNATVSHLDNHIIGCRTMAADGGVGTNCTGAEAMFADMNSPALTASSAKFTASMLTTAATCPNVRAALP
jgi:hypothetical protein